MLSWLTFHLHSELVKSTLLICFGDMVLYFMLGRLFLGKVYHGTTLDVDSDWTFIASFAWLECVLESYCSQEVYDSIHCRCESR